MDISRISALTAWRPTQGIYRYHPALLDALWATPVQGKLPTEHLHRLPEWCVYVEVGGREVAGLALNGFFAHLDIEPGTQRESLRLLLDFAAPVSAPLLPVAIQLGSTFDDGIDGAVNAGVGAGLQHAAGVTAFVRRESKRVEPLLSLLLYLCTAEREIRRADGINAIPRRPNPKTRRGRKRQAHVRLHAAAAPTVWDAGFGIGAALERSLGKYGPALRRTVRPHVRRAHWHTYWTGSRDRSERRAELRWIAPMLINGADASGLGVNGENA